MTIATMLEKNGVSSVLRDLKNGLYGLAHESRRIASQRDLKLADLQAELAERIEALRSEFVERASAL